MAKVKLGEFEVTLSGDLPSVGSQLPDFLLADGDLQNVGLEQFKGKRLVLNIFPSMSTPVCSAAAVKFNALASQFENTVILCISRDLGFSHKQFCLNHNINDVIFLSDMRKFNVTPHINWVSPIYDKKFDNKRVLMICLSAIPGLRPDVKPNDLIMDTENIIMTPDANKVTFF